MLGRVSIQNSSGIGARVDIDLRPVTLLFGPNSAGKNTILHAIHVAHAVLGSGTAEPGSGATSTWTASGSWSTTETSTTRS